MAATLRHVAVLTVADTAVSDVIERLDSGWPFITIVFLLLLGFLRVWYSSGEDGTAFKIEAWGGGSGYKGHYLAIADIISFQDC